MLCATGLQWGNLVFLGTSPKWKAVPCSWLSKWSLFPSLYIWWYTCGKIDGDRSWSSTIETTLLVLLERFPKHDSKKWGRAENWFIGWSSACHMLTVCRMIWPKKYKLATRHQHWTMIWIHCQLHSKPPCLICGSLKPDRLSSYKPFQSWEGVERKLQQVQLLHDLRVAIINYLQTKSWSTSW